MTELQDRNEARSEYLLDGRRVVVADLIEAGLIEPGTELRFVRTKVGEVHEATVRKDGWMVLADGREFRSPSKAAAVAASARAFDGWHAWVVKETGRSLDSYRQELLEQVVHEWGASAQHSAEEVRLTQQRHEKLKEAKRQADADEPVELTVRELLEWWGATRRGTQISRQVESDLVNYGLVTVPNFLKVTPNTRVQILSMPEEVDETVDRAVRLPKLDGASTPSLPVTVVTSPAESEALDADEPEQPSLGPTAGNLPSASGPLVSITPQATFEQAITLMLINDYSQLAVLSGSHRLFGAISWKSIAQAKNANPAARLVDAIVEAPEARYDAPLIDLLPSLQSSDFIFIRDETEAFKGIVTTADVVDAYGEFAKPFMLIGALDQALRGLIARYFSLDEVARVCGSGASRAPLSYDDLSFGQYVRVLQNPELWARLGWSLDRTALVDRLDELREIRNDVMHFNPDPLPQDAIGKLRNVVEVLQAYGSWSH